MAGTSYGYDGNGNLISDGTHTYSYDVENRLVARSGAGTSAALRYDPLGRLHETVGSDTGATRFLHDGSDLIAEYDAAGTLLRRYVHGDSPGDDPLVWFEGASVADSARRYLFADERGSIVATTDANGTPITINTYDEYGQTENMTAAALPFKSRFRYTGQLLIPELGLYYYKARMYAPRLGRFMQTDPIGYDDGMNMYAYVGGDPVNFVDPMGMNQELVVTGRKLPRATFSTHGPVRIGAINVGTGLAPGPDDNTGDPIVVTCDAACQAQALTPPHLRGACSECVLLGLLPVTRAIQILRRVADWFSTPSNPLGLPDDWIIQSGQKPGHTKYVNPRNSHDYVRIKPNGTITQVRNGLAFDRFGNRVPLRSPAAHGITPDQFIFRP